MHTPHAGSDGTVEAFQNQLEDNLYYSRGAAVQSASPVDVYLALSRTVRDHLIDRWRRTTEAHFAANPKFVYYLSAEYLLGRQLTQNLLYTDTWEVASRALDRFGLSLDKIIALDGGRIREIGSHHELLARQGLYSQLYQRQLELAATEA